MVIQVDGELLAEGVPELDEARRSAEGRIRLDLSNLRTADASGIETLRALREQGVVLSGASAYIDELLERRSQPRADGENVEDDSKQDGGGAT